MKIEFSDEFLAQMWDGIDWEAAEEHLINMQRTLTVAAFRRDDKAILDLQKRIVRDQDNKCLAVRHVASHSGGPGIDGVRWRTSAQKMRAALSLTSKGYKAQPLRQINLVAKNTGKVRHAGLPTYYDRAMQVLYGYSFLLVAEAQAERKSFAF